MTRVFLLCMMAVCTALQLSYGDEADDAYLKAAPKDLQWWRDARFGMFVHWGPVSLKGKEISWSRGGERRGSTGTGDIPVEEYDNLYKQFNPGKFHPKEWVRIAKAAGMKYIVFTTKHHDGFCEFDSKLTDYKITNSPYGKDIVAELAKACREAGFPLGFYYSPVDWHHPDYRTEKHADYTKYLHGHMRELCTNYGKVAILWFDSLGGTSADWDSPAMFKMMRTLQPGILINNRGGLPGDFDTPEQTIGAFQTDRPWESCITIGNQWSYRPNDSVKALSQCIRTLVQCAGGDGNLLLNVGPLPTGEIEPAQVERLKQVGAWLRRYGESIYGTRGGPFMPGPWGASTCRGKRVYLHILDWEQDPLKLPAIGAKVVSSRALTGGKPVVRQTDDGIEVSVPKGRRQEIDTLVALDLDTAASAIKPVALPSLSVAAHKKSTASNVFAQSEGYGPAKALDDDLTTRWATDSGISAAWLEVDLGEPTTLGRAVIDEEYGRVQEFELQYREGDTWRTFYRGTTIGRNLKLSFPPVTARFVRLNILQATEGPTLWEFQLRKPGP